MGLESFLLTITIIVFQIYCIVVSVNILSNKVFSKRFVFIMGVLLGVSGTTLFFYAEYYSLVFIAGILMLALRWKKKRWFVCIATPLVTLFLLVIISYLMDAVLIGVFQLNNILWNNGIVTNIVYCTILLILTHVISAGVNRLIRSKPYKTTINKNVYLFASILVITIVIIYSFIYIESLYQFPSEIIFFNGILFMTLLCMIAATTFALVKVNQRHVEIEKQKTEQEQLTKYTLALEKLSNDMSDFNHDYINILASLHGYIEKGDQLLLKNYFQETIQPLNQALINSKNQLSEYTNRKDLTQ